MQGAVLEVILLTLLSPAKKLLKINKPYTNTTSEPEFLPKTAQLLTVMQSKSVEEIAALMDLSNDLAQLNYNRYQHFPTQAAYPALFLFQGDVYQSLDAKTWDESSVDYAQKHLRILSGLYGMLKPLDLIQPYRLEMGVRLANSAGPSLYDFWRATLTNVLNQQLKEQANPVLLNLASTEYFKAIDLKKIQHPVVTANFYEKKDNQLKMIGIYAKKARGALAQFIMCNQLDSTEAIKQFTGMGYQYNPNTSSATQYDFVREH